MARLSFSRWPSLFFCDFQAPSVRRPASERLIATCFTALAAKTIRGIDVKSDLWVKKYRHSRHAQGKSLKAPRECFSISPQKAVDKCPESMLKPPLLQKTHNSGGSLFLFLKLRLVRKKFGEKINSTFSVVIVGKLRVVHTE